MVVPVLPVVTVSLPVPESGVVVVPLESVVVVSGVVDSVVLPVGCEDGSTVVWLWVWVRPGGGGVAVGVVGVVWFLSCFFVAVVLVVVAVVAVVVAVVAFFAGCGWLAAGLATGWWTTTEATTECRGAGGYMAA